MQVSCSIVDWAEISRRHAAGTLSDDLMDLEGDEEWFGEIEDWYDSAATWSSAQRVYAALAPHLSSSNRSYGDHSLRIVFGSESVDDLNANLDCYVQVWSPQRVQQIATAFQKLDDADLARAFAAHCPKDERDFFADFNEFKEYCEQWKRAIDDAAEQGRGVLCHCG